MSLPSRAEARAEREVSKNQRKRPVFGVIANGAVYCEAQ